MFERVVNNFFYLEGGNKERDRRDRWKRTWPLVIVYIKF